MPAQARRAFYRELQVLPQRHMRKERIILEDISTMASPRRHVKARRAIEQNLIVQQDAAFIGMHESGDGIERQRFARAAGTKQDCHSGSGVEFDIQRKTGGIRPGGVLLANPRLDHKAVWRGPKGLGVRRFASVRMASAIAETIRTSTRAVAPLPPSTAS